MILHYDQMKWSIVTLELFNQNYVVGSEQNSWENDPGSATGGRDFFRTPDWGGQEIFWAGKWGGLELFWSVEMGGQRVFPLEIDEVFFFQK